jgi:hypothetical protein
MTDEWTVDDKGNVIVRPLVSYRLATAFGMGIVVRLEFVDQPIAAGAEIRNLQLAMTPKQAAQLAQDLLQVAESTVRTSIQEAPDKPS